MEGEKALLKLKETYYYFEQYICFTVTEADAGLFYTSPFEGKVYLVPGVDIDKDLLGSIISEKGIPVEIKTFNVEDEEIESFLSGEKEAGEETGEKNLLMLFQSAFGSLDEYSLEVIGEEEKTIPIFPFVIDEGLDSALEFLRDCEGVSEAEFSGEYFLLKVDPRVSLPKILQEIETWLGNCLNTRLSIIGPEEYQAKFSRFPPDFQVSSKQKKLKFP